MKKVLNWTLAAAALASLLALGLPAQAESAHDHGAAEHALTLNHGAKWATDAPLRAGMDRIHGLVAPQLGAAHAGKLQAGQYRQLADQVGAEIAGIVADCQLEPAADAVLHVLIADLGTGVDAMSGKTAATPPVDGLLKVAQAVNQYQTYFEHPGFRALPIAH